MIVSRVAYRYAEAFYESLPEQVGINSFLNDLLDIKNTISSSRELYTFFISPIIPNTKKREILDGIFRQNVSDFTITFLSFLLEKRRESLILEIIEGVFNLNRKKRGIVRTKITSFRELSDTQKTVLNASLVSLTKKTIEPEYATDESLLGGVVVRVGDIVYDGSVTQQLHRLKTRFVSGL